jgi:hypothetical protein
VKASRTIVVIVGLVAGSGCQPSREELARREAAAKAEAQLAEQVRAGEVKAREDARAARRKQHEVAIAELRATFVAMTPIEREQAMRKLCATGRTCTPEARATVTSAVASDAEGRKLRALANRFGEGFDNDARDTFAAEIAADYGMGILQPVVTSGSPGNLFLIIHGRYCSEERVDSFIAGPRAAQAVALGYDHVVCSGPSKSWERDLK